MKKVLIASIAALSALTSASVFAYHHDRDNHHRGDGPKHCEHKRDSGEKLERLTKKLELSDDQVAQIKAIREEARANAPERGRHEHREALQALDPGAPDYQEQVSAMAEEKAEAIKTRMLQRADTHAQVFAVLTPEQQEKMKALKAKKMQRMQDRRS